MKKEEDLASCRKRKRENEDMLIRSKIKGKGCGHTPLPFLSTPSLAGMRKADHRQAILGLPFIS